jgi:hypothetical protein
VVSLSLHQGIEKASKPPRWRQQLAPSSSRTVRICIHIAGRGGGSSRLSHPCHLDFCPCHLEAACDSGQCSERSREIGEIREGSIPREIPRRSSYFTYYPSDGLARFTRTRALYDREVSWRGVTREGRMSNGLGPLIHIKTRGQTLVYFVLLFPILCSSISVLELVPSLICPPPFGTTSLFQTNFHTAPVQKYWDYP